MTPAGRDDASDDPATPESSDPYDEWWEPDARQAQPAGTGTTPPPTAPIAPSDVSPPPAPTPATESAAPSSGPPSGRSKAKLVAAGVGAFVLAAGTVAGVRAATSHPGSATAANPGPTGNGIGPGGRGATVGTLAGVHGSVLTVKTTDGRTVTVNTSGSTTVAATVAGTPADVKVGDRVTARGTSSGANALTADQIGDTGSGSTQPRRAGGGPSDGGTRPPGGPAGPGGGLAPGSLAAGTVSAVNGDTLSVTANDGTVVTVTTSPSTKVTKVQPSSVSALAAGQTVRVVGTTESNGSVTATAIQEGEVGFGAFGGRRGGPTTTTTG